MELVWRNNFSDPYSGGYMPIARRGESLLDALRRDREFWDRYIKGPPKATETFTTEQLQEMGMHGLYEYVGRAIEIEMEGGAK